jgi:hypothetical protein
MFCLHGQKSLLLLQGTPEVGLEAAQAYLREEPEMSTDVATFKESLIGTSSHARK